jgi:hypothetical protein
MDGAPSPGHVAVRSPNAALTRKPAGVTATHRATIRKCPQTPDHPSNPHYRELNQQPTACSRRRISRRT